MEVVDLFAGPGGWDVAARSLGLDPLGFEIDDAACRTREAAGLRTRKADIAALDPLEFAPCDLLIASPPCPTFSRAGKRDGIADMPLVWQAARAVAAGEPWELSWRDTRSELVVEPLRWALALQPTYLAWEQVPDVLEFWQFCAELLRPLGWSVWTGVVEAERYGVPQTRERAILVASCDSAVDPPPPTHQRYVRGEPQRHEVTLEGEVLPWVSMAETLGWNPDDEVGFPRVDDKGGEGYRERDRRPASEPSFTIGEKARSWTRIPRGTVYNPRQNGASVRSINEPAPTLLASGLASGVAVWDDEQAECPRAGPNAVPIELHEAAALQTFPPDYPFGGSRSKQFEQVGNAVPPKLAEAILGNLLGL
jgi:DNA (cytosine-5)-methyltransferase 1